MGLEQEVGSRKIQRERDYLPFGVRYLEAPEPIGYKTDNILSYTSVTFCTWKFIPLVDDGD
ncbi:hypothetical protein J4471_04950 [Candidatus Woesearchaeota archaeon]|nr:hypothetical protein [Candidatus Woesearchaeota archaeon]HLD10929.1 hypothetical protein [Candidatus Nanoarchaeia archaeon]